ncbi:hypothetical protein GDO81_024180 [Engystomops pustulosus]|uniref:Uncharacterized protein n=1 Tax=Engystomops pustulosus TaxID=76066 RepID=A0AAV6Z8C2_ENGPU|nr:hypothetical protein GDO81_024180 [Engystomops pustulosus]
MMGNIWAVYTEPALEPSCAQVVHSPTTTTVPASPIPKHSVLCEKMSEADLQDSEKPDYRPRVTITAPLNTVKIIIFQHSSSQNIKFFW